MLGSAAVFVALIFAAGSGCAASRSQNSRSPGEALHMAVRAGNIEASKAADPGRRRSRCTRRIGQHAFTRCGVERAKRDCANILIEHGADVNARHKEAGSTPLQYAVLTGRAKYGAAVVEGGRAGERRISRRAELCCMWRRRAAMRR